ncbi:inositol monophosphatase family protein [Paenibacillus sp. Soil522]|uniref:inositol monophosphatase family protein n=1 Tax=Paenibacillus sp. Soil522 TaxID=1736388 RepID=UPI0006FF61F9|nr:inositol monophosphatase family protein [Paenibacillus sp. Soil522]KRE40014.1 inositol phosphatase [Paenibacillus sp. Soil522]
MDQLTLIRAREVAIAAAYEAGRLTRERFGKLNHGVEKDEFGDIVTEVDHLAENIILNKIRRVFPAHKIRSEEYGENDLQSDWMWLVDPLDGTNNYAVGLPLFGISITLAYKQYPVLAVIYEPMTDRLYVATEGEGTLCNSQPVSISGAKAFQKARVGWIQGHAVQNEQRAVKLRHYIDVNTKRMMRLWAPTLQWTMLARGDLDAIIVYNSEGEDLYSGILMVKEAGGVIIDYDGHSFTGINEQPFLIACQPKHQNYFIQMVKEGLA